MNVFFSFQLPPFYVEISYTLIVHQILWEIQMCKGGIYQPKKEKVLNASA